MKEIAGIVINICEGGYYMDVIRRNREVEKFVFTKEGKVAKKIRELLKNNPYIEQHVPANVDEYKVG